MQTIKNHSFLYRTISQESKVTLSTKKTFSLRIYVSIQISTKLQPTSNREYIIRQILKKIRNKKKSQKKKKKTSLIHNSSTYTGTNQTKFQDQSNDTSSSSPPPITPEDEESEKGKRGQVAANLRKSRHGTLDANYVLGRERPREESEIFMAAIKPKPNLELRLELQMSAGSWKLLPSPPQCTCAPNHTEGEGGKEGLCVHTPRGWPPHEGQDPVRRGWNRTSRKSL